MTQQVFNIQKKILLLGCILKAISLSASDSSITHKFSLVLYYQCSCLMNKVNPQYVAYLKSSQNKENQRLFFINDLKDKKEKQRLFFINDLKDKQARAQYCLNLEEAIANHKCVSESIANGTPVNESIAQHRCTIQDIKKGVATKGIIKKEVIKNCEYFLQIYDVYGDDATKRIEHFKNSEKTFNNLEQQLKEESSL